MTLSIKWIGSPNKYDGRKSYRPEAIVIHIMEGTLLGTDKWFGTSQSSVSAHYGIGKNGEIHQYVKEEDTAWHAGRVDNPVWRGLKPAGEGKYINPNYYTIGIEHEGNEDSDWPEEMYLSSAALIKDLCTRWNIPLDRDHIIGHHEIYSKKTCPGHKVDLLKLIALAQATTSGGNAMHFVTEQGTAVAISGLNIRSGAPSTKSVVVDTVSTGTTLHYVGYVTDGQAVNGNAKWYKDAAGNYFWAGAVKAVPASATTTTSTTTSASPASPAPSTTAISGRVYGIDLSHYNQSIDWNKQPVAVDTSDHITELTGKNFTFRFCFVKATQGVSFTDNTASGHADGVKKAGLLLSYYHFGVPDRNPSVKDNALAQAAHFTGVVSTLKAFDLPLALDIEENTSNLSKDEMYEWISVFLTSVQEKTGHRPILYSYTDFLNNQLPSTHSLGQYPLWLARYCNEKKVQLPAGWTKWQLWQFDHCGKIDGQTGDYDFDVAEESYINSLVIPR